LPAPVPEWEHLPAGHRFEALPQSKGPHYLSNPAVADVVAGAIQYAAAKLDLYELHAWVVMSNHVHMLIDPKASLSRINQAVKNFSAREANRILGHKGLAFWANESYDHWVRSLREFENIIRYIEENPVCAGLVASPQQWRWSSAKAGQEARLTESDGGPSGNGRGGVGDEAEVNL
jgi:REP element-mobilizing transposase RayT